ncbi:ABC transporter substrate-binding protein, partial [Acinetobacter baumannii]
GEIDFVEQFPYDLLPMIEGNKDLKEESLSPVGYFTMYRFNFKYPPFNNKKIRQAAMYAIGQEDVMKALVGNPKYWKTCASLW